MGAARSATRGQGAGFGLKTRNRAFVARFRARHVKRRYGGMLGCWRGGLMTWGGAGGLVLLPWSHGPPAAATPSLTYSPIPLCPLLPLPGTTCPPGCRSFAVGLVLVVDEAASDLSRWAEFQTPTIFDHDFDFIVAYSTEVLKS